MINNNAINSTNCHGGRFGNLFFVGMVLHFISKNNNLKSSYKDYNKLTKLGIDLFIGEHTYDDTIELRDNIFYNYIIPENKLYKNISIENNMWGHTKEFALFLQNYFNEDIQKNRIINNNIFKDRYNNNNDIFIHVRLGDIIPLNLYTPFIYYDKVLSNINFDKGYISSDSIENTICQELIKKYNLEIINEDEVTTIMFATTCKNIILSSGTFSWLIGLLSYYSNIFYPKIYSEWHGNIFVFPDWKMIDYY